MSPPPIPGNQDPQDEADYRFEENSTACEWGECYHPGGYHPVHLGDTFQNQYRVIRKIGYGANSTVWLAIDFQLNRYVALKIAVASFVQGSTNTEILLYQTLAKAQNQHIGSHPNGSQYLVCLLDSFKHYGPNGHHACFVFEPMGPNLDTMLWLLHPTFQLDGPFEPRFPKQFSKRVLREILLGLEFLHSNGVVHGDLHMGNILMNIRPLEVANTIQRLQQSPSQGSPLQRLDSKVDQWAPSYLIEPAPLYDYTSLELDPQVKITDLGAAFLEKDPPAKTVTAPSFRAPELILGSIPFGKGIDIWSFGCLVFELLTGSLLFRADDLNGDEFDELCIDEHLLQLSEVLDPLPETMFAKWHRGDQYFDREGQRINTWENNLDQDHDMYSDGEGMGSKDIDPPVSDSVSFTSHSVPLASTKPFDSLEKRFKDKKLEDINEAEETMILQLIRWILQHDPSLRPSAAEILQHPWFIDYIQS